MQPVVKITPEVKELNKQLKERLKSIASWSRDIKHALKEQKEEYKIKQLKNSSDAIYSHSVRICDIISDYKREYEKRQG